ncbi:hypothetical protein BDW59DRAFT_163070 [Aspergillus cavernicola]|uniref:Uncharacterized protein n=1 Tax=Aspergillus cavernicola TaxID=176166 RepID=A0ABR4I7H5_9EURO
MSLKRKASFSTITSPQPTQSVIDRPFIDDSPKHLHCRTRKRVRNDRPDDQTVYENTLRWLFTAQQRAQMPTPPADRDEEMEPKPPTAIVDPRQQTLFRFFRPVQPSHPPCPSTPTNQSPRDASRGSTEFLQGHSIGSVSPLTPSEGNTLPPAPQIADGDGDMDMDVDMRSDEPNQGLKRLAATLGWM